MNDSEGREDSLRFAIFRNSEAGAEQAIPIMESEPLSPVAAEGARELVEAGIGKGHENRVLFCGGGFSLIYAWFKSGYPLPRHTHNADCLYYIVAGSLILGGEELGAGDGFFIAADVPYTYVAGEAGLELLEFRGTEFFNIKLLANNRAFWDKAVKTVAENRDRWDAEPRPSESQP